MCIKIAAESTSYRVASTSLFELYSRIIFCADHEVLLYIQFQTASYKI